MPLSPFHRKLLEEFPYLPPNAIIPLPVAAAVEGCSTKAIRRRYPPNLPRPMAALFGMEDIQRRFATAVEPFHHSMDRWHEPLDKKLKGLRDAAADFAPSQERLFREAIAEIKSHAPPATEQEKAA
jgi:hypothetical protein